MGFNSAFKGLKFADAISITVREKLKLDYSTVARIPTIHFRSHGYYSL